MDIETIITNNNNVQENVNNQKSSLFLDLMNLNNYKFINFLYFNLIYIF